MAPTSCGHPHRESETKELSMVLTHLSWRQMRGCVRGRSRQHSLTPETPRKGRMKAQVESGQTTRRLSDGLAGLRKGRRGPTQRKDGVTEQVWPDARSKVGTPSVVRTAKTPSSQCRGPGFDTWSEN